MLDAKLINKLCKLGLTSKQAKIYWSVVISGASSVADISIKTAIHEQDIYKILPKLEKLGLLTKIFTKPIKVESIPIEKALASLIEKQQEIIESQEEIAEEIVESLKKRQAPLPPVEEGKLTIVPGSGDALKNRAKLLFENLRKAYDILTTEEVLIASLPGLADKFFGKLAVNRVPIRILITTYNKDNNLVDFINKLKLPAVNLTIKRSGESGCLHFAVVDNEAWIPLDSLPSPSIIVTDIKSVVQICREHFDIMWQNPSTRTLFPQERNKRLPKRKRAQTIVPS
jgi:sugar-specific transcriptional regulator TrmB